MGSTGTLTLLTRGSPLALAQVEEALTTVRPLLPADTTIDVRSLETPGDRDLATPLTDVTVPEDFFTRDLDEALLRGEADLAVHSAKDLPQALPKGLVIAALLPVREIRDALVLPRNWPPHRAPSIIGTSSPRRIEMAERDFPGATLKPIRGTIQERLRQLDAGDYEAVIVAACALLRLGLEERIGRYLDWEPAPQQGRLAMVTRADHPLATTLQAVDVRRRAGLVALVGCPAEAALLCTRARQYIEQADTILHDRLLPDEVLLAIQDRAIAVGKAGGEPSISQVEINQRLLQAAESGKLVVRLQGGDPGIFGHLGEELAFLQAWGIRTDVVPALTAAQVAAARSQVPLTHREAGRSITFVSAHAGAGQPPVRFPGPEAGNLAIYMPVHNREEIYRQLMQAGWSDTSSITVAERLGYKDEAIWNTWLADLPGQAMASPAVLLVGPGAHPPPRTTLFVGTNPEHFLRHGPLIHWPLIKLRPTPLDERVHALAGLDEWDGILFPSRFSVACMVEALMEIGDTRLLHGKKLLAVGPSTADELKRVGLRTDLACETLHGVRELVERLPPELRGRYLYPCSDAAPREERRAFLRGHGIELAPHIFYRNREMPFRDLPRRPFARVLFTSSSTVRAYFGRYPEEHRADRTWIAVGPSTRRTLEKFGLRADTLE